MIRRKFYSGACAIKNQPGYYSARYFANYGSVIHAPKTGYAIYKAEGKADDSGVL